MATFDVILPAGGHLDPHFAGVVGTPAKPLIKFEGVSVLYRMIQAFRESGVANRLVVVGSPEVMASKEATLCDFAVKELGSSPANIIAGIGALADAGSEPERVLICTTDLPFITPEGIRNFVNQCGTKDFYAPLISDESYGNDYPNAPATFVKLRDGVYTTGCLYNVNSAAVKRCLTYIEQVFQNRKSKLAMANILGVGFTLKYLTKQLRVADVETRISELLHCSASAVPNASAELAYDIDYLEDYHYVLQNWNAALRGKWMPPAPKA